MLRSGAQAISTLLDMGIILDVVFQLVIYHAVHPGAALLVGPILICMPYALSRALTTRLARRLGGKALPLPKYRLLPFPQLSLLTIPAAVTLHGGQTEFGDLRFLDIAVLDAGHSVLWGVGRAFVFPTASTSATGLGKWQAGPAVAVSCASLV